MNKEKIKETILSVLIYIILINIISVIIITIINFYTDLSHDFGKENIGKSLSALYQVKTNKDIDYIEIEKNKFLVKNAEKIHNVSYNKEEDDTKEMKAIFRLVNHRKLYEKVEYVKSNG